MAKKSEQEKPAKGPFVAELEEGMTFIGYFIARNPRLDPFRDPARGKYLRMQLIDRTGCIEARMWEDCEEIYADIDGGGPVKVDGVVERFQEVLQVRIRRMRAARAEEIAIEDMIPTTERDRDQMWAVVLEAIEGIQDAHLSLLVDCFYGEAGWAARFREAPSARRVHHAYFGGFLEHTYELLVLAQPLMALYPEIDRDLLVAGILLHDIGKMEELSWSFDTDYTDEGRLLGHIVLGERAVSRAVEAIEGFPERRALELLHVLVSHHGRHEWGSPRRPKSIEAIALHHLDNLDAQVNRFKLITKDAWANGETWTTYDRVLRRSLYTGIRQKSDGKEDVLSE